MLEILASWGSIDAKERDIWLDAANRFRLPYWDWARTKAIPSICRDAEIEVLMPGNRPQLKITNPLTKFRNPKLDRQGMTVAMGDLSMGENRIKDDKNVKKGSHILPVSITKAYRLSAEIW